MTVRNLADALEVGDIALRITERLREQRLGLPTDQRLEGLRPPVVGEPYFDAILRQRVRKQIVSPAVQRAGGDDVVTRLSDRRDCIGRRGLPRCQGEGRKASFERSEALLEHVLG